MKLIPETDYANTMESIVVPYLLTVRKEGVLESFDGTRLKWYGYAAPDAKRTVVIVHGFTEASQKFVEMIWYFLHSGANVYVYDQRGHGDSTRYVNDLSLTHVARFEEYVRDLECFVENVVPKDLPLAVYAHSMGGAVTSLYLEAHPDTFEKAVLTSPMIAPATNGIPLVFSKLICYAFIAPGKARERIFLASPYNGIEPFEESCDSSRERFEYYAEYRRNRPTYQNNSPTYRWVLESLNVTAKILKKGAPERIKAKVFLCTADTETMVKNSAQDRFAARLADCRRATYRSKHEIYKSTDDTMKKYVADVLDFLA